MPITLNHSNIGIQYNTGSNYIIETVKSDLYLRNEIYDTIVRDNLQAAPVTPIVSIQEGSNIYAVESYTYSGTANTADFTRVFPKNTICDILIVAGGGGGGKEAGGGGGAGGLIYLTNQVILAGTYNIKVGKGGSASSGNGSNSSFGTFEAIGGGGGASMDGIPGNGGSGGGGNRVPGAVASTAVAGQTGGTGTANQGNNGGTGKNNGGHDSAGGGGGGAGAAGDSAFNVGRGANGGIGRPIDITGTSVFYAGGGGGGSGSDFSVAGTGGTGGGGNGGTWANSGTNGINGLGGGGGGGSAYPGTGRTGGAGGSGIVIIRYLLGTIPTNNLLTSEPTVISPVFTETIRTFTHSGGTEAQTSHTITVGQNTVCDILVVGGGGGGGSRAGSGGGAGAVIYSTNITLTAGTYIIKIGKGGNGASTMGQGNKGEDSSITFGTTNIYLAKGGGGGFHADVTGSSNKDGGSGAGNTYEGARAGNAISTNIPEGVYGYPGGSTGVGASASSSWAAAGGGGAGQTGRNAILNGSVGTAGNGGNGLPISISGTSIYYGGGGGGGRGDGGIAGSGGLGGGGTGGGNGGNGTQGTGGGGGGGGFTSDGGGNYPGGAGGSGIVIIKFKSLANPIPEGNPITHKRLNFAYNSDNLVAWYTNTYTLNFPVPTIADINNNSNIVLRGAYDISLSTMNSSIIPKSGQYIPKLLPLTTSNISIRYNLLNPVLDPTGAQWTYNTSNTNVYHMGSVGIGTKSPEYQLDVRGTIYSSLGGYTSSALTKWSVLSDRRIKENIVKASYEKCLENVKNIELYNFNFKDNCVNTNDRHQLGFIAQEVQQVYPKAVEVSKMILNLEEKIDDLLTLNITQIDYTLYGAVKSLIEKMENIKIKMEQIKTAYDIP